MVYLLLVSDVNLGVCNGTKPPVGHAVCWAELCFMSKTCDKPAADLLSFEMLKLHPHQNGIYCPSMANVILGTFQDRELCWG